PTRAQGCGPRAAGPTGHDPEPAAANPKVGGSHSECAVDDIVEDEARKRVSTPAYMVAKSISEAASGINKLVDRVLELTHEGDA
ncbi:isoprenoid biosynthesis protein ElbB, partial [Pseudomonas syringae]